MYLTFNHWHSDHPGVRYDNLTIIYILKLTTLQPTALISDGEKLIKTEPSTTPSAPRHSGTKPYSS
jgi:hypothetical protein